MTESIVRKDVRELAPSAVALTLLGVFCLAMVRTYVPVHEYQAGIGILICLAWVCALVTSVQPFAHEVEAGTQLWLDALPASRRFWWQAKAVSAGLTTLVQVAALVASYFSLGLRPQGYVAEVIGGCLLIAANGWASGLCGSALARTSLAAFGWALVAQHVAAVLAFGIAFLASVGLNVDPGDYFIALVGLLALPGPLALSRYVYTRPDRDRRPLAAVAAARRWTGERALAWLTWQQVRVVAFVVVPIAIVAGMFLAREVPALWPAVGYAVGGILGVAAFAGDQDGGAYRFFGDRRLPPGRIWLVKTAVCLGVVACALLLCYVMSLTRLAVAMTPISPYQRMNHERYRETMRLLSVAPQLLGPLYGFAVGQLLGLTQRKPVIALVLTAAAGVVLAFVLGPPVVVGEFAVWQWIAPPLVLLAATCLAVRPWVSGRLTGVRAFAGVAAALAMAGVLVAGGLWGRLNEVPNRVPPFDVMAFQQARPTPEKNEAGRRIVAAAAKFAAFMPTVDSEYYKRMGEIARTPEPGEAATGEFDAGKFLDKAIAGEWPTLLSEAVSLPIGFVDTLDASQSHVNQELIARLTHMGQVEAAQGQRLAARGDVGGAVSHLFVALRLSRHLRARANGQQFMTAAQLEGMALKGLGTVIDRPEVFDQQLRNTLRELVRHERELPDEADTVKVEYLRAADYIAAPPEVLAWHATTNPSITRAAGSVPWEQDRQQRILALVAAGHLRSVTLPYSEVMKRASPLPPAPATTATLMNWTPEAADPTAAMVERLAVNRWLETAWWLDAPVGIGWIVAPMELHSRVQRRALTLQFALALYERTQGKLAVTLDALVPDLLSAVPLDPVDATPFRYRVSQGETVALSTPGGPAGPQAKEIAAGQGVVWSIGPDCRDEGGRKGALSTQFGFTPQPANGDIIFVVPKPAKR